MTDYSHHKHWAGPFGPFYKEKQSTTNKWLLAIVIAAVMFITFVGIVGFTFWMFFSAWFNWIDPLFNTILVIGVVSATCWVLSFISPRPVDVHWRRVFISVFGCSCIAALGLAGLVVGAAELLFRGVLPKIPFY